MLLWSLLFLFVAIGTGILAFSGIVVAVTFFAKIFFLISLGCFIIFGVLFLLRKNLPKE